MLRIALSHARPGVIYEVFVWPWLRALSAASGRTVTLADVPAEAWDALALPGVEMVWLMGVWERSEAGRAIALSHPASRAGTAAALPDATDADVVGSPYCVRGYVVDPRLGGRAGLAAARAALAERGLRLLLDFVPNHVASDHRWAIEHPEYFVRGGADELAADPAGWMATAGGVLARGRDPYFSPWPDVVQLDPTSGPLREAVVETLLDVAKQCDGVRCDMAMLALDDVADRTWGERLQRTASEPYWSEITRRVRAFRPGYLFVAEVYWDFEAALFDQGIDLCYDKRLYDRLVDGDPAALRRHLRADPAWQARLVRFLENHDEPAVAAVLTPERLAAAALVLLSVPGTVLLHEGQLEGRRVRLPVHLARRPAEAVDARVAAVWRRLLAVVGDEELRSGRWELLDAVGWDDNRNHENLLAWRWRRHLVVVNYSPREADGRIRLPALAGARRLLVDVLDGQSYDRDGDELAAQGLYVRLAPYAAHVFRID